MTKQFHDQVLSDQALDQLFLEARSYNGWLEKDVSEQQIKRIYDLLKMGPTSANMQPARLVWCKSQEAKDKLAEFASDQNKKKIKTAPVCVIIGYDIDFHEELPWLFPHTDAKSWFEGDEEGRETGAARNSAAGRLSDAGGAITRAGLRANVRGRSRQGHGGILRRRSEGQGRLDLFDRLR